MPKTNISEKDSRPMVKLQSVLEPTDEIQRNKAIVQRCKTEIRRLDAEIQATLEVERYDKQLRQNNHSRPVRHKENAYDRALQTNTVNPPKLISRKTVWEELKEKLGKQELVISYGLWKRYKNKGSVINRYELVIAMNSPAIAMELWELWDHIGMIKRGSTSRQRLASAGYLAREIREGTLGYQDGRSPKLKMRRHYEYLERPANRRSEEEELLEIVQPECVILSLAEIDKPQTIRIGREWIKGPDGKQAHKKPFQLPEDLFKKWLSQGVRKLYSEWEPDAYKNSLDDPGLRGGCQRKNEDEDSKPLDALIATSTTMNPSLDPLDSLIAAIKSQEASDEVAQLIEITTPKQQELIQIIYQIIQDNPAISPRQARLEAYRILEISPDTGRMLLHRIRK